MQLMTPMNFANKNGYDWFENARACACVYVSVCVCVCVCVCTSQSMARL